MMSRRDSWLHGFAYELLTLATIMVLESQALGHSHVSGYSYGLGTIMG
jgi:hypothetical protein